MLLQLFGLGPAEILLIILFIIILVMGPKRIPELFRSLGQSVGEFKKGLKESEEESAKNPKKKK